MASAAAMAAFSLSSSRIDSLLYGSKRGTAPSRMCRVRCRARSSSGCGGGKKLGYYGYDLYELLGVENSAPQPEIKKAYRWLQKRCHPDVAGELGHDMSILLNEAYSILSDPASRSSYDTVRSEWIQFEGYTGEPIYSKWMGPSSEERAVFVDEVRCIGCLQCALIASNTFAVEKRFGRARAVSQWGDSKPVIDDAIRACPVDCISWVDRNKLAALEYLMSKQPRYAVNVDPVNSPGERAIDVFRGADKFLKKNAEFQSEKENPAQRYRAAATDRIQARAGRWWHFFVGKNPNSSDYDVRSSQGAIVRHNWFGGFKGSFFAQGKTKALYEAVTQHRVRSRTQSDDDEYWEPIKNTTSSIAAPKRRPPRPPAPAPQRRSSEKQQRIASLRRTVPAAVSLAAVLLIQLQTMSDSMPVSQAAADRSDGLTAMIQDLAASPGMHPVLAGVVWYVIASVACGCLAMFVDDTQA